MSFANPQYFYLLIALPIIVLLYWLNERSRERKIARMGRADVVRSLIPQYSVVKHRVMLGIELLVMLLVIVVLARPRAGASRTTETHRGIELMVAVDVSNSMRASSGEAGDVSRLQRAKLVAEKLIENSTTDKVGLIVFAGNAYLQMPITGDLRSAKLFLSNMDPDMVPSQGTAIGTAITIASQSFSPNPNAQKAIVVITDGENFEDDAVAAARKAASDGYQVDVVGVGTTTGAPIPMPDGSFLTDESGEPVTTRLDEDGAQEIANAGGGTYVSGNSAGAVMTLKRTLDKLAKTELQTVNYTRHDEQFPVFAWLTLILLIASVFVTETRSLWLNRFNFFNRQ